MSDTSVHWMRVLAILATAVAAFGLGACSSDEPVSLDNTVAIEDTGYVVDYPSTWVTDERIGFLGIGEEASDISETPDRVLSGPIVTIEHPDADGLGLDDGASVDEFVALSRRVFRWPDDAATSETVIAGSPATVVRFAAPEQLEREVAFALGTIGDQFILMTLQVGNDRSFDDVFPTFEAMLASIREG